MIPLPFFNGCSGELLCGDTCDVLLGIRLALTNFHSASASSVLLRQKIVKKCREDIYYFLNHENGQVAIYDAVNPISAGRRSLAKEFAKHDIEVGGQAVS
jgi:hypothetical protein